MLWVHNSPYHPQGDPFLRAAWDSIKENRHWAEYWGIQTLLLPPSREIASRAGTLPQVLQSNALGTSRLILA